MCCFTFGQKWRARNSAHRKLFSDEFEFEGFCRYLRYASQNSFIHLANVFANKIVELLQDMKQAEALEWFQEMLTGAECIWMICHLGP